MSKTLTRREIMLQGALYGGTLWLLGNVPRPLAASAASESTGPAVMSATEWNTVEAITGRIIPTDHEPGAIEANCVNFIDKALLHEDAELGPTYHVGVRGIDAVSNHRFGKVFAELDDDDQDAVLTTIAAATPAAAGERVRGVRASPKVSGKDTAGGGRTGRPRSDLRGSLSSRLGF